MRAMIEWVSVTESLPEIPEGCDEVDCLIAVAGKGICSARYRRPRTGPCLWIGDRYVITFYLEHLTHWAYLPTPPDQLVKCGTCDEGVDYKWNFTDDTPDHFVCKECQGTGHVKKGHVY